MWHLLEYIDSSPMLPHGALEDAKTWAPPYTFGGLKGRIIESCNIPFTLSVYLLGHLLGLSFSLYKWLRVHIYKCYYTTLFYSVLMILYFIRKLLLFSFYTGDKSDKTWSLWLINLHAPNFRYRILL